MPHRGKIHTHGNYFMKLRDGCQAMSDKKIYFLKSQPMPYYAFCAPDFFRKYRAKKASEKPMSMIDTATHN